MLERALRAGTALGIAVSMAFALSTAPVTADGPCEEDPYCHPDLKRDAGDEACAAWECNSALEICCLVEH